MRCWLRRLHCELAVEVFDILQGLLIVLLGVLLLDYIIVMITASVVVVFLITARFILRQTVEIERRDNRRSLFSDVWPSAQKLERIVRVEAVVVFGVVHIPRRRHVVHNVRVLIEELLES